MTKNSFSCKNIKLFYNLNNNNSEVSQIVFGSTMIETFNGNIFARSNLNNSIGKVTIIVTIYDINNPENIKNNLFNAHSQINIYLPDGNLQFITAFQATKDNKGLYIFSDGKKTLKIINGTNKYLNAEGYITIDSINTFKRAKITFTKC
jgi:hypothetical protein